AMALLRKSDVLTEVDVRDALFAIVEDYGSKAAVARFLGVSESYYGRVSAGTTAPSPAVYEKLGLERVLLFRRKK
ncbi:MAG: hypothetical protein WBD51_09320, partial [Burkholderiaceae bacterium]